MWKKAPQISCQRQKVCNVIVSFYLFKSIHHMLGMRSPSRDLAIMFVVAAAVAAAELQGGRGIHTLLQVITADMH